MAEPHPRVGKTRRRRPARALMLTSAIIAIVFSGLFMARSANAATAAKAAPAATAATAEHAVTAEPGATSERPAVAVRDELTGLTTPAQPSGICNVPGVGDIGGLIGLCQAGSGLVTDFNNICTSGAPTPELATSGINSLITTPGGVTTGKTLYDNYGLAGQFWASTGSRSPCISRQRATASSPGYATRLTG